MREFESWLITDMRVVRGVLDLEIAEPANPESLRPGEAKKLLDLWSSQSSLAKIGGSVRTEIADKLDLSHLERHSRSFGRFLGDLKMALDAVPRRKP